MDLQSLQSRLYADFADFVGREDGYAFYCRFDNLIGVTNGIDREAHAEFQEYVRNHYPISISIGIGTASTPLDALAAATEQLQDTGSAQDPDRIEILGGGTTVDRSDGEVTIGHFDIVDVTRTYTDTENAARTALVVRRATLELAEHMQREHDSIAHFVGGDNIIAVCPRLSPDDITDTREAIATRTGIDLQVGIGHGRTAHAAGHRAKHALEDCRETGDRVCEAPDQRSTDSPF
jgi:GTP cyclohydrolase IIa